MNILIFVAVIISALFIIAAIFQIAVEIARFRCMIQTYLRLEPVNKRDSKYEYKQKAESFEDNI
jgi:hypothetical protein